MPGLFTRVEYRKIESGHLGMKLCVIAASFTTFHLVEDLLWLAVGRYSTIPYAYVVIVIILLGILGGVAIRHPKVKQFLGN